MDGPPMQTATTNSNTVDPGASSNSRVTQTQTPPPSIPNNTHRLQLRQRQQTSVYTSPSSRTVRTNWIAFMRLSWQRISRTSKVIIGITSLISMAEIVITIVMLILGRGEQCDKPLDMYLIVFVIRLGFSMPLTLYQHLWPSGYNADNIEPTGTESASTTTTASRSIETTAAIRDGRSSTTTSTSPSHTDQTTTESTDHTPSHSAEPAPRQQQQERQQENSNRTSVSRSWIDRIKSFLDLVSILWFIVGNYFIFTASAQCHHDAKYLFYTTMTWILLGYFLVLIPLLLCAVVIFCLPCLIVAMRTMNIDYTTGMVGANKTEIQSIPIYKFRSAASSREQGPASSPIPSTFPSTPPAPSKPKKHGIMALFPSHTSNHQDTDEEAAFDDWTTDPEDASCTICLSDYEDGDLICNLRCNHHFHKDCVCEWLALNFKCPLCQRDFRRGRADGEDEDKTDSDHSNQSP